jgi:zinc protease
MPSSPAHALDAIHSWTLDNGLRLAVEPDPSNPMVGLALYYDVGSRNEVPGQSGYAHLFEHMMFQGSAHVGKAEHFRYIGEWGGEVNGTTSQDRTNYYESLPSHQLDLGLWLEADRMRALAVTPENFENQRQTVMEERRQRVDDSPYGQAFIRIEELSYQCWAYAHPVIGSWEDLEAARFEDADAFHERWYKPDNAVLAVAGDVDPQAVLRRVQEWFGDIPRGGPRPAPDLREPPRAGPVQETITDRLARLPALMLNHPAPAFEHPDFFVHELIETLLFRGPSSRLYRRLVVDTGLAVQISGGYDARRGPSNHGLFAVAADAAHLSDIADIWQEEVDRLKTEPLTEAEWQKGVNQIGSTRVFERENPLQRALALGRALLYHGDPTWEHRYLGRLAAVTPADVLRVAARDFDRNQRVELHVVPA